MKFGLELILLAVLVIPNVQGAGYLRVDDITMKLQNGDAVVEVNYTLNSFARLYVLALGCRHLEPDLNTLFSSFGQVQTVMAFPDRATINLKSAGNLTTGYYLFDSRKLGARVHRFTVVYPGGTSRTFHNVTATPNVFVEANFTSTEDTSPTKAANKER